MLTILKQSFWMFFKKLQTMTCHFFQKTKDFFKNIIGHKIPDIDIAEYGDKFMVWIDLPGINPNEIKISILNNNLLIKAERTLQSNTSLQFLKKERFSGKIQRKITIPSYIESEGIHAKEKWGVLEITLPRKTSPEEVVEIKVDIP